MSKPRDSLHDLEGLVLIDGQCVLCSASFRFVARRDPACCSRFSAIQQGYGRRIALQLGIDPDDPTTFVVVRGGRALVKSDGALAILESLPGWRWIAVLRVAPRGLRDWAYDRVARNRHRLFGRLESCMVPSADMAGHMASESPESPDTRR